MLNFKLKIFVVIAFLFVSLTSSGQGLFEYFKLTADDDGPEKFDRIVFDFNYNSYLTPPSGIKFGHYSLGVSAYWFKDVPLGKKSNVALAFGLGFDSHNVHSNGKVENTIDQDGDVFVDLKPFPDGLNYRKNKLSFNYVEAPIELRFRTMNKSLEERMGFNFRFYLGFKAGVLVNDHFKYVDAESKLKVYNLNNTNWYRYGPTLRVGFNKIAFNGFYSLTSIFKKGKGVDLVPFSVGISWMRF